LTKDAVSMMMAPTPTSGISGNSRCMVPKHSKANPEGRGRKHRRASLGDGRRRPSPAPFPPRYRLTQSLSAAPSPTFFGSYSRTRLWLNNVLYGTGNMAETAV
jgi:hypothetical protein